MRRNLYTAVRDETTDGNCMCCRWGGKGGGAVYSYFPGRSLFSFNGRRAHVESRLASLRWASYFVPWCATGAAACSHSIQDGLLDDVTVEKVGHEHGGAGFTMPAFGVVCVSCDERINFLSSMACGLSLDLHLASGLHWLQMLGIWWKSSCLSGSALGRHRRIRHEDAQLLLSRTL